MFKEFVLPYLKRVTDRFGPVYYGCCEPQTDRLDMIIEAMPNLRTYDAAKANDCNVELLFRDVYDVGGDRSRLKTWVDLARKVFEAQLYFP